MKAVIDTNVLIYDTYEDSLHHDEAATLLDDLGMWIIPLLVIYEYVWFLKGMGLDAQTALEKLEDYLLSAKARIVCEDYWVILRAMTGLADERLPLGRFNDEVILRVAHEERAALATFDRGMRARASKFGIMVIP